MKKNKSEYYDIYKEFYKVNEYRKMKNIIHHGDNRLSHINRVGKFTYYLSKFLKYDYITCTRGALMHDFFLKEEFVKKDLKDLKTHPSTAYNNSKKYFKVNDIEKDIIINHMYPITKTKPKYKESVLVSICDKLVSIYEVLRFKLTLQANLFTILLINILKY